MHPFALGRPVGVTGRDLRQGEERDTTVAEVRQADGVPVVRRAEPPVGLLPAGGGCLNLWRKMIATIPDAVTEIDLARFFIPTFMNIAMAKVSTSAADARSSGFENGRFATIYLSPRDYHRVHLPLAGTLRSMVFVPGDLFSVNSATVARIPGLFRRNERLILHFSTPFGPCAQILVGALNVGSISTPWTGEVRPRKSGVVELLDLSDVSREVEKGDLLGWFNMGSTVIVLFPAGVCEWHDQLVPGATVRMGESIGKLR